ncbi:carbohydrate kinase family protein [Halobaculum sp. MBLA0143]|uniref:carbohydrate kinase family protein n=1 Tax=Halobaculum sp. MBLA0143 TaxID=3079933 RepID=UPI003525A6D8
MQETLVVGETIVDMHPDGPGSLAARETFHRRPGGAPANVAVGLARLGAPPAFWTRLGEDGLGEFLAGTLADEGVPDDLVQRDEDAPTGLAVVSADDDGDRGFVLYLDGTATTRLQPGRVGDDRLAATEWLHLGGVELAHEPARSAVFDLLERAPPDTTVSLDPNARPQLWTSFDYADTLSRVLPDVDVLVASVEDLRPAGYDGDPVGVAARVADAGPHTALVTRGADGAVAHATPAAPWGPAETAHEGFPADVVDTTGAGDAFTAGVVHALGNGRPLSDALRFADAVAAESTTARGAMAALPDRAAVERLLE